MEQLRTFADVVPHRKANAVEALYAMGHSLLSRKKVHDAACICRALLTLEPSDERGWLALGSCHEAVHQYDLALELYRLGGTVVATSVRCDLARARLLRALGRLDQASDALDRAVSRAEEGGESSLIAQVQNEASMS